VCPCADTAARKTYYNLPYDQLHAPALGPAHPFSKDGRAAGLRNHRAGHVEDAHLSNFHFDDQYNTFMTCASLLWQQPPTGQLLRLTVPASFPRQGA